MLDMFLEKPQQNLLNRSALTVPNLPALVLEGTESSKRRESALVLPSPPSRLADLCIAIQLDGSGFDVCRCQTCPNIRHYRLKGNMISCGEKQKTFQPEISLSFRRWPIPTPSKPFKSASFPTIELHPRKAVQPHWPRPHGAAAPRSSIH